MSFFKCTSRWQDIPGVEISIPSRGEDMVYREGGREYHFEISCLGHPVLLFAGRYWDGAFPVLQKHLTDGGVDAFDVILGL